MQIMVVSKSWCKEINSKMQLGYKVVQGYIDSKNPNDSWITSSYSIAFGHKTECIN